MVQTFFASWFFFDLVESFFEDVADCVASCHAGCADGVDDVGCHFFGCEDVDAYGVVLAGGFLHELSEVFSDSWALLCHL